LLPPPPSYACLKLLLLISGKDFSKPGSDLSLSAVFGTSISSLPFILYVTVPSFCVKLMGQWTCLQYGILY
jgi:hypothetical protein